MCCSGGVDGRLIGGRYRLLEPRGTGGTAAVWRATDERTGRPVAVKLLHPHLAADPAARERLQREALAMGGIDHANVVAVRDLILDGDRPALVMDFIDGQSLGEALLATGAMPEAEALRIASEAAEGLAAVHAAGLVHRDLKPANILLGVDGRARVTDLGIAASVDPGDAALTATDGVAGTLRYLAPERLLGEPATPATDVWGLGVVLVEMLTGAPAFPGTSIQARVGAAGQGVARPDGIADPVWAIIARATADDPAGRYPTAEALAVDLRVLAPAATAAAAAGPGDVDPWADTVVIPLPVAAVAPVSVAAVASAPVGAAPAMPGPSARHRGVPLIPLLGAGVLVLVIAVAALGGFAADAPGGSGDAAASASAPAATNVVESASPAASAEDDAASPSGDDKRGKGKGRGKGRGD